ncbi:oligopeptide transporter [Stylosanthes scabra]|uniref:Oligopeptide transporter n=1 Tax=Stylosanthes scabra TaxID=79078 RepID=A0ABU6ZCX1_9FABA|nr:oligopeptide transporter [Stylosanthes scabra]
MDGVINEKNEEKLQSKLKINDEDKSEEENDCPIEQVRLTVPITDDPNEAALTFRTWVLGIASCVILSFVNQFFGYRTNPISITSVSAQIVTLPIGKFMAATLPTKHISVPLTKWSFTLNPGPFTIKEHALITIIASAGYTGVYAIHIVTIVMAFYHRGIHPVVAIMLSMSTQMLGYRWAGIFRRILVDSPYMWWSVTLVQLSLFKALHEKVKRPKGGLTRIQFFLACLTGLGIGSFALDWNTVAGFLESPLAYPSFAIINTLVGYVVFVYILVPVFYWGDIKDAKKFPLISSRTFDSSGNTYNVTRILNSQNFDIDLESYNSYSKLYLSGIFALDYGLSFATLTATISHVALFYGSTIYQMTRKATEALRGQVGDVHTRIMKKNYEQVPEWWFVSILLLMTAIALAVCEGFGKQLQLPWWGVFMSLGIALVFTLPIGIIQATTNTQVGLNVITGLIIGFLYPGKPLANVTSKTYGYISMSQALSFLNDFKLGHYMKIPPKFMFIAQLVGTIVASSVYFGTARWLLTTVENICDESMLPEGSPWTCPKDNVFYSASII